MPNVLINEFMNCLLINLWPAYSTFVYLIVASPHYTRLKPHGKGPADNLKYPMDNPPGHPGQILEVSRTWPHSFFFEERGGTKHLTKNWKSRDLWLFTISFLF